MLRRTLIAVLFVLACAPVALAAGGGRAPCASLRQCRAQVYHLRHAVAWQQEARAHEAHVHYAETVDLGFQLADAIYGMPQDEATGVGTCESHLNPNERNSETATGVMQELDSTFSRTPFAHVRIAGGRIASFDPIVNILAAGYIWHRDGGSWREWDCAHAA